MVPPFTDAGNPESVDEVTNPITSADLPPNYFEIYRLAVEMADRISARRGFANNFFLTINTALLAFLGSTHVRWYAVVAGIAICIAWWAILKSYRELNRSKFATILALEGRLAVQPYHEEWMRLRKNRVSFSLKPGTARMWLAQYQELGQVESIVPWVFVLLYVILIIVQA